MSEETQDAEREKPAAEKREHPSSGVSRRTFAIGVGSTLALLGMGSLRYIGSAPLVRPPGGQDEVALVAKCTHCYRCAEVCPQRVIVFASIEDGFANIRTPRLRFSDNYPGVLDSLKYCDMCSRETNGTPLCVASCGTGALSLAQDPADVVMGTAVIDTELCMAYRSSYCSYCYDACKVARGDDSAAIYLTDSTGAADQSTRLPMVDAEKCNGCGACEAVCVSAQAGSTYGTKNRAITVRPVAEIEAI